MVAGMVGMKKGLTDSWAREAERYTINHYCWYSKKQFWGNMDRTSRHGKDFQGPLGGIKNSKNERNCYKKQDFFIL